MPFFIILTFTTGCIELFPTDKASSFPDNPLDDFDRDGLTEQLGDCDDLNPEITGPITYFRDADNDGYGDDTETLEQCDQPEGYVRNGDDCDDNDSATYPGSSNEGVELCVRDDDGDGYGDSSASAPFNAGTDCDDSNPDTYPGSSSEGPLACVRDDDGDGFGDISASAPFDSGSDCNDAAADIYPGNARNEPELCTSDADGDGYGDMTPALIADAGSDCDDNDARVYPGNNFEPGVLCIFDDDGDGFGDDNPPAPFDAGSDCDDTNPITNPWGLEVCDDSDNDCDGDIDEVGAFGAPIWYVDVDGDGYGNDTVNTLAQCGTEAPDGYASVGLDCDDTNANTFPGKSEDCDGVDNNCNSQIDEGVLITFYSDLDGDGYGSPVNSSLGCSAPAGFTDNTDDCDDNDAQQFPGADEYCNGEDDNCDGATDENTALDVQTWYYDEDGDSYGNSGATLLQCYQAANYVSQSGDCDDADALQNPNAIELCNNEDDDCNGLIDDNPDGQLSFYLDNDNDGDGDMTDTDGNGVPDSMIIACPIYTPLAQPPVGYSATAGDCNDNDNAQSSLHPELCSPNSDENCDGNTTLGATDVTLWFADTDGDGFGNGNTNVNGDYLYSLMACPNTLGGPPIGYASNGNDCNDNDEEMFPGAVEICNGKLQDCNAAEDDGYGPLSEERDDDGDGYIECDFTAYEWAVVSTIPYGWGDCNDDNNIVYPGAPERCTGEVEDCNSLDYGTVPSDEYDDDGDGYVECTGWFVGIWQGEGTVVGGDDCDDDNEFTYTGAAEISSPNLCVQDANEDGYPDCARYNGNNSQYGSSDYLCDYGVFLNPTGDVGPDFVLIPSGDDPLGRFTLTNDFYLMTTEVTQAMFEELMLYNPSYNDNYPDGPVENLTLNEAKAFSNALSTVAGLENCYDETNGFAQVAAYFGTQIHECPGYRLPTEAELNYASRAGTAHDLWTENGGGNIIAGQNSCPLQVNLDDGSTLAEYVQYCGVTSSITNVARLKPNGFNLYDTLGNVEEWTDDGYFGYTDFPSSTVDPVGFPSEYDVAVFGGHYGTSHTNLYVDRRGYDSPAYHRSRLGFRLARTAP